jgi:hypothetical protein
MLAEMKRSTAVVQHCLRDTGQVLDLVRRNYLRFGAAFSSPETASTPSWPSRVVLRRASIAVAA